MDSGLGSDDEKRNRTKAQKQLQNEQQQLFSSCFIDATSLGDDGEFEHRRNDERRQGALIFRSSIPQYSMLQMPHATLETDQGSGSDAPDDKSDAPSVEITTPHNSIVQLEAEVGRKTPIGFYVDLGEVEVAEALPALPAEKKNIFSMVIDFNVPKREMPSRLSTSLYGRRKPGGSSARSTLSSCSSHTNEEISGSYENISNGKCAENHSKTDEKECADRDAVSLQNAEQKLESIEVFASLPVDIEAKANEDNKDECKDDTKENDLRKSKHHEESAPQSSAPLDSVPPRSTQQFVKLSDLEEQSPRLDLFLAPRMSRSIPEKSWVESPLATFRSASYRSSPQPFQSDLNEPAESNSLTDSSTLPPRRSAQRLGTDLLRMFLEEIGPDVTLEVNGRRLRAHRCILSSRCHYFAAVFGGNPSESVVAIQGYSYAAVHFALCHIYSGASHIPQSISLVELAALSDMLGLEGLKEVVAHALKVRHCHNFHKPCSGCITGVVEVLPLTAAYGLDELYQASLRWITQHFVEVWPSRAFANLPRELRDKCYQQHVVHMAPDSVLQTTLSCDRLLAVMPTAKWAEAVAQLTLQLADHCQIYLRQNYAAMLASSGFLALDTQPDAINTLLENLLSAAGVLKLDQACRSYINCHKMLQKPSKTWSVPFLDLLRKIHAQVESCVVRQAAQASRSSVWAQLEPNLRKRIRDLSAAALARKRAEAAANHQLSSSSDSSRNSSPAIKSVPRTQTHSPSLRRSLLMAARTTPAPSSPSTCRRTSTLTNPTQSSAAKSTTKNTSSQRTTSNRTAPKNAIQKPPPRRDVSVVSHKEHPKRPVTSNTANTTSCNVPSVRKAGSTTVNVRISATKRQTNAPATKQVSERPEKIPSPQKQSMGVRRSGTFLKDEPTVLGKM